MRKWGRLLGLCVVCHQGNFEHIPNADNESETFPNKVQVLTDMGT